MFSAEMCMYNFWKVSTLSVEGKDDLTKFSTKQYLILRFELKKKSNQYK